MLVVCDNMKIVEVPEEGRRCFIFRRAGPERKRRNEMVRQSKRKELKCGEESHRWENKLGLRGKEM